MATVRSIVLQPELLHTRTRMRLDGAPVIEDDRFVDLAARAGAVFEVLT